jgi:two-component system KDP operon response regulator KdpE
MNIVFHAAHYRSTTYPPAILLIAERIIQVLELKQALENNGCQVHWTEASTEGLDKAKQKYFDLIVLDIDPSTENGLSLYQALKSYPELADLPAVILAPFQRLSRKLSGFEGGPVHFLVKDSVLKIRLLQLIEEVHYLRDRYLDLIP